MMKKSKFCFNIIFIKSIVSGLNIAIGQTVPKRVEVAQSQPRDLFSGMRQTVERNVREIKQGLKIVTNNHVPVILSTHNHL